jgi:hypothetical protein
LAVLAAPLAVALVWFAGRNHRTPERNVKRLAAQAVCLLVIFALTDVLLSTFL